MLRRKRGFNLTTGINSLTSYSNMKIPGGGRANYEQGRIDLLSLEQEARVNLDRPFLIDKMALPGVLANPRLNVIALTAESISRFSGTRHFIDRYLPAASDAGPRPNQSLFFCVFMQAVH